MSVFAIVNVKCYNYIDTKTRLVLVRFNLFPVFDIFEKQDLHFKIVI